MYGHGVPGKASMKFIEKNTRGSEKNIDQVCLTINQGQDTCPYFTLTWDLGMCRRCKLRVMLCDALASVGKAQIK